MKESKKLVSDVGWSFLSITIKAFLMFALSVFIGRFLGAADLGLYQLVFSFYSICILSFMIASATIKYVAEYKEIPIRLNQVITCSTTANVALGVFVSVVVFFSSYFLPSMFKTPELQWLLRILSIIFPFFAIYQIQLGFLNGFRNMRNFTFLTIGQETLKILLIAICILLGLKVAGAVLGMVFSMVITAVYCFFLLKKTFHIDYTSYKENMKNLLSFGYKSFWGNIINEINHRTDVILIGYFLPAENIGYYSVAILLIRFLGIIPQSIQKVTFPATSSFWEKNDTQAMQSMIAKAMRYNACVVTTLGLFLLFFSKHIIVFLFNENFTHAVMPFNILILGAMFEGATTRPVDYTLAGIGRPEFGPKIAAAGASTNILLNILLIPKYGISGAAIATSISLLIVAALNMFFIAKIAGIRIDYKWHAKLFAATLLCILLNYSLANFNDYIAGCLIIALFTAVLWFKILSRNDRVFISEVISHRLQGFNS